MKFSSVWMENLDSSYPRQQLSENYGNEGLQMSKTNLVTPTEVKFGTFGYGYGIEF